MKKQITTAILTMVVCVASAQDVTLGSLLEEMVSRKNMAVYPELPYQTKQFSSYDRRARVPGGEHWFANQDNTNFLRREITENGSEWVMFDSGSPGAIVRWWMTFAGDGAGEGIIRIYIDGEKEPVIEGKAFDIVSGGHLAGPPLSTSVSELTPYLNRGHNLYLPIPFGKSCKITYQGEGITANEEGDIVDKDVAIYYVINYRSYDPEVEVESFTENSLTRYASALSHAQLVLAMPFSRIFSSAPEKTLTLRKLRPGESMQMGLEGAGRYIRAFKMQLDAEHVPQALRSTVISFRFDGQNALKMPVGDFFGTGYQINPYETFYTRVYQNGMMVCAWPMPFQSSASIEITNLGEQMVILRGLDIYLEDWQWDDRSMYFGGSWKNHPEKQTGGAERPEDLTFNSLEGKGVYVGDLITLYNDAAAWWGEGDEKIYVDGEEFPSHFGTGTEDYYGYAWGRPEAFDHPFIAQPDGSGNLSPGTTVNIRFRGLDKIPFTTGLKMSLELWHWRKTTVHYAPATFFYLRPGGKSETAFREAEAKRPVVLPGEVTFDPVMEAGKMQGENMEPIRVDAGFLGPQAGEIWDGDAHLWWRRAELGDALYLQFISDKTYSDRDLELQLTKARDYGIVSLSLNGDAELTFDGYATEVSVEKVRMSKATIREGVNTLQVVVKGRNEQAVAGNMFGIDYLEIK